MVQSTMGTQVLDEADIIDIMKQHFYRYGQGFKQVKVTVDLIQRDQPRIGMEIGLEGLNPVLPDDRIEKIYYTLLDSCKESTNVEEAISNKVFYMVTNGELSKTDFMLLTKRLKGS